MSFLQIDQKAVTEDEARVMLTQTYALQDPLGTPTLFLNPDDFSPHWLEQSPKFLQAILKGEPPNSGKIKGEIHDRIDDFVDQGMFDDLDEAQRDHVIKTLHKGALELTGIIGFARLNPDVPKMTTRIHFRDVLKAHYFPEDDYDPPIRGVVVTPQTSVSAGQMAKYFSGDYTDTAPEMPGTKSQHQFNIVWHEVGHGTGAGEPQTELMAGLITRKAFADNKMLSMNADGRAVRAVFQQANMRPDVMSHTGMTPERNKYGWPMVEVNDYAVQMNEAVIDGLDEDAIKRVRFQKFDHQGDAVKGASNALKWEDPAAFDNKDLAALGVIASGLAEKRSTPPEHAKIYSRFALACQRLLEGTPAYENAGEREAEQNYMTFDPDQFNMV